MFDISLLSLILASLAGTVVGTIIGMLPGIGVATIISILLPATVTFPPVVGLVFVATIYYSAQYSGSTTSILFKMPGETSSAMTCIDGYQLTKDGNAGKAIVVAALSSFFAGLVASIVVYVSSPLVVNLFTMFPPVEIFMLTLIGLTFAVSTEKETLPSLYSLCLGLMISFIGINAMSGVVRFTKDIDYLYDGLGLTIVVAGLVGGSEVLLSLFRTGSTFSKVQPLRLSLKRKELVEVSGSIGRGTLIGSILGFLPGGGAILASITAYLSEKKFTPGLGTGKLQGVAAPEAANNAAAQTAFVPLITFGIPENAVTGLIFALMLSTGIPFGAAFFSNPSLLITLVGCMLLGNLMAVTLNLPLVNVLTNIYRIPEKVLFSTVGIFLLVGVFLVHRNLLDIVLLLSMSLLGVLLTIARLPTLPVALGFILGPQLEDRFNKTLIISNGDLSVFVTSWVFQSALVIAILYYLIKHYFRLKNIC